MNKVVFECWIVRLLAIYSAWLIISQICLEEEIYKANHPQLFNNKLMHFFKQKWKVSELILIPVRDYQARHMRYLISVRKKLQKYSVNLNFQGVKWSKVTAYSYHLCSIKEVRKAYQYYFAKTCIWVLKYT